MFKKRRAKKAEEDEKKKRPARVHDPKHDLETR